MESNGEKEKKNVFKNTVDLNTYLFLNSSISIGLESKRFFARAIAFLGATFRSIPWADSLETTFHWLDKSQRKRRIRWNIF